MAALAGRPNTALLVVDVQNGVVADAYNRAAVVRRIAWLVSAAREEGVPVIWVRHSSESLKPGTDAWNIVPELEPRQTDRVVAKSHGDAFEETELEAVLSALAVGHLVVVGAQTDFCIRSTLHGAFVRGYDATLVGDAHTTEDLTAWGAPGPEQVIAHTNLYWAEQTAPGSTANTVETENVRFRPGT